MAKVLVADDEPSLVSALRIILTEAGYAFCGAHDGREALRVFAQERPDLVVLDIVMPHLDGFEVCERIRAVDPNVPILMLSAKSDIVDKKIGFRAGTDDYLTKPFNEEEILLRVEALLRRRGRQGGAGVGVGSADGSTGQTRGTMEPVTIGDLRIDPRRCEVTVRGRTVTLTPKEFQILALMADAPGRVFTREDLIEEIWGKEYEDSAISIPTYVRRIREKIEDNPSSPVYLQTVWRFGYKLGA